MYIIFHFCLHIILNITQCTFNIVFNVKKWRAFHIILHLWIKILQEKELSCRESTHLRLKSENSKQNVSKVKLKVIMYEVNELVTLNVLSKCACYFLKHNAKKKSRRKFSSHLHLI